jgi:hypothetical protein
MTSQSSSKTLAEAGSKSQGEARSRSLLEDMWSKAKLRDKFNSFAQWVTSDSPPVIREVAGTISCMTVVTYVSGYTFGTWFHKTKNQLINKINDQINRPL